MKVSFARQVKEEVVFNDFDICCQKAILSAIIKVNGTLSLSNQGLLLTIRTENAKIASKVHKMLKEVYHPHIEFLVSRKMKLQKNNVYILKVSKAREILDDLGLMNGLGFHTLPDKKIIQKECCKRAFLRGTFLAAGSISDPEKGYHLEIVCSRPLQAQQILEILTEFEIEGRIVQRKKYYVVYIKEGAGISDFLNVVEAHVALMEFENSRIVREVRNTVNRRVNCETANITKTVTAAARQVDDILFLQQKYGFEKLPVSLRQMAEVRLEYPEAPLKELGMYLDPPVGKSGVNHRLRKLCELADAMRS